MNDTNPHFVDVTKTVEYFGGQEPRNGLTRKPLLVNGWLLLIHFWLGQIQLKFKE